MFTRVSYDCLKMSWNNYNYLGCILFLLQDVKVDRISDTVSGTTDNIKEANEEIREVSSTLLVLTDRVKVCATYCIRFIQVILFIYLTLRKSLIYRWLSVGSEW